MKVTDLHALINAVSQEILGETAIVEEDLSNVVSIGKQIIDTDNLDNYTKKLINHIGKVKFSDRLYSGGVPSVLMDSWEFGSILEKISCELPEASQNDSYNLIDGQEYGQDTFYQPTVSAKFFNNKVTFEINLSFTEKQVKESFSNATQLNAFVSMLTNSIENSMTVKLDALIMRTINNMTAETLYSDLYNETSKNIDYAASGTRAINLLTLYNEKVETPLTVDKALNDVDFIRFATYLIGMYVDRLQKMSTLFNIEGKERFTAQNMQNIILLSDFSRASETFLASNTFNAEKIALPVHERVSYWQASGTKYTFDEVSKINVQTSNGHTVSASGIIGVIFDREALGVSNLDRRVTTHYNAKAEFYNNFYKFDAGYYNDLSENFVVFFIA